MVYEKNGGCASFIKLAKELFQVQVLVVLEEILVVLGLFSDLEVFEINVEDAEALRLEVLEVVEKRVRLSGRLISLDDVESGSLLVELIDFDIEAILDNVQVVLDLRDLVFPVDVEDSGFWHLES